MIEYDLGAGPQLFDPVYIDSISISSIDGLPEGLTYSCNNGLCSYQGGESGCFSINGTPLDSGEFNLSINLNLVAQYEIFGIMIPIEVTEQIPLTLIIDNCENNIVLGCTDEMACNYDSNAIMNDQSCIYPGDNEDCNGCIEGFTQLNLSYQYIEGSSFNISNSDEESLFSIDYNELLLGDGFYSTCFPSDFENECLDNLLSGDADLSNCFPEYLQNECVSIEIVGDFIGRYGGLALMGS